MPVGDIKYIQSVWVQEVEVDSNVEAGDLLEQNDQADGYTFTDIADDEDPTVIDAVAVEEISANEVGRVLLSGAVEVLDDDDVFNANDWSDVTNVVILSEYPYDLETGNIVIYLK